MFADGSNTNTGNNLIPIFLKKKVEMQNSGGKSCKNWVKWDCHLYLELKKIFS